VTREARARLVRIPRDFLHLGLDDLESVGVSVGARRALVSLLADLPAVPTADDDALLVGSESTTLPCLAVLARHVVQGLRDHNINLMHDRARLRGERLKVVFISQDDLRRERTLQTAAEREAALFLHHLQWPLTPAVEQVLVTRAELELVTFGAATAAPGEVPWRRVVMLDDQA